MCEYFTDNHVKLVSSLGQTGEMQVEK
jgi:hypothetical protein